MTDNQERAKKRLEQYRRAVADLEYHEKKTQLYRDIAAGVRSPMGFEMGWTGKYRMKNKVVGKGKHKKIIQVPTKQKILAQVERGNSHDPHAVENRFCALDEKSRETDAVRASTEALRVVLEGEIDEYCSDLGQREILKSRYILLMTFAEIERTSSYSESSIYRLHREGLETFGEKMIVNSSK